MRTLPIGPPRFNEQENGSLRPLPLVPMLLPTELTCYALTYLAIMTVQDVTTLSTLKPHGGPITHSSTGSELDSLVPPCSQSYSSRLTSYVFREPLSERWSISDALNPLFLLPSDNDRMNIHLKLLIETSYLCSRCSPKFQLEILFLPHSLSYLSDNQPCKRLVPPQLPSSPLLKSRDEISCSGGDL